MAQILIVERWCLEERNQLGMRLRIVGKDIEHHCALVAQQKFDRPVLCRLEPRGMSENRAKRSVLGRRQGFEHRPLLEKLLLDELNARQYLEARIELVDAHESYSGLELVDHELHPKLRRLMLDDEQHLVVPRRRVRSAGERLLRCQQRIKA